MSTMGSMPALAGRPRLRERAAGAGLAQNAWWIYLSAMALMSVAYVVTHFTGPHWLNSGPVYNLIGGATVIALVMGARAGAPGRRMPWYLLAVGQGLFLTSDIVSYNYEKLFGSSLPTPSLADPFHLAFYPFFVAGMLMLSHDRNRNRERAGMIDALIVTFALATLLWVYLIDPYIEDSTFSLVRRLTSIAYPTMDIFVLGVLARAAAGSFRREPAFALLFAGAVVLLLTDALYFWRLLDGGYSITGVLASGWALFFALLGAAALHPSKATLSEPAPHADVQLTRARLALLACASLTAPLVIIVREALHEPFDHFVVISAAGAMFTLVLARMAGIVRSNEQATSREEALRIAGEALVTASTREEIHAAALDGAGSVVEERVQACMYLLDPVTSELRAVEGSGCEPAGWPALRRSELPKDMLAHTAGRNVLDLQRGDSHAYLAPLVGGELLGVLCVYSQAPLRRAAQESLATLASAVALALHSAELTEQALQQRSESRLSALIKNASDVVCIVAGDGSVHYMSPSARRTFGYDPDALVGSELCALFDPEDHQRLASFIAAVGSQPAGEPLSAEFHMRHHAGRWCDVEALGTNLLGDEQIAGIVLNIRDISERKSFEAELEHQAFHDTLTGLPNRALLRNRVEHALASQRRNGLPVAVLFLDVDDFKNVNDSLGHDAGDEALGELARRLEDCMRPVDTAARLGGDEFAVLIQEAESEMHSVDIAQRLLGSLGAPMQLGGRAVSIGLSIGIAFSDQGMVSPRDADELLRNADAAMYMAKESGKGQYRIFEPAMHALALSRLELKSDLQRALDAGEFTLRYQPIMDLARGDMAGMEALVRWEHPDRGIVPPLEFIPLLEDTGLIVGVGHHVLREACRWGAHMQRECPREPPLSMAVNVSVSQLQRPEFIGEVAEVIAETGIVPSSLTLELTESVMMADMELSLLRLNALRALGVKLAIDDFGTGYSSLNYVRQFPVDILKIDRSFLADRNPEVTELTAAIVQVARIFNLKAVAEGIESAGQLEQLRGISCDFGQGFHFAKPLSGPDVQAMAEAQSSSPAPAPRSAPPAAV
jgi:diguanylate cyclase (GGDEF)-like protein/PAS domain S-box-containing protein